MQRNDWTFVLCTPDSVLGGSISSILECLEGYGIVPGPTRMVELNLDIIKGLYGGGTQWFIENPGGENVLFSLDLHEKLYELSPACLVMLSDPLGAACKRTLEAKGKVWPEISPEGTVRHLGENVVLNSMHCPDDPRSAEQELAVLVGQEEADRLREATLVTDKVLAELLGFSSFMDVVPVFQGWEATSFVAIANRINRRVIQRMCLLSRPSGVAISGLVEAVRILDRQRESFGAAMASKDRLLAVQSTMPEVQALLNCAASEIGRPEFFKAVDALADLHDLHGERNLDAIYGLQERGLYISQLEKVILGTHSYSFRPNDNTCGVYCGHGG